MADRRRSEPAAGGLSRGFTVGSYRGVEIVVDFSLILLALLLVWSLYADLVRLTTSGGGPGTVVLAVIGGLVFLATVLIHELSHTVLALRRGLPVARIRLFVFGGVSEIEQEAESASDEFVISVAGPIASALVGVALIGIAFALPGSWNEAARTAFVVGWANIALAVFNLLPGFPLDGGRALRALLWRFRGDKEKATQTALTTGRVFGLMVIGLGGWLAVRGLLVEALWTAAVGWFVYQAAMSATIRERLLAKLRGRKVADAMRPIHETVRHDMSIGQLIDFYTVGPHLKLQAVERDGRVIGVIGQRQVDRIAEADRLEATVADHMLPIGPDDTVEPDVELESLLTRAVTPSRSMVVVEDGRVTGLLSSEEFGRFVRSS